MDILKEFQSNMHDVCEASMSAYIQSEQYRKEQNNINNLIAQLKQSLSLKDYCNLIINIKYNRNSVNYST